MKNVLVITPPTEFMVFDKFRTCLRFSAVGGNLISSMIDKLKYNVDYYDIDAFFIKEFTHISCFFESEIQLMHELKYYLKNEETEYTKFFYRLMCLLEKLIFKNNYEYILCSLPCYGNSRQDCENQMRMACIIINHLKQTKGTPITVAGGNWWENLDISYWTKNIIDPSKIIDFLIYGSMQVDEIDDLLDTGYARKAYSKNKERDKTKGFQGRLVGKKLGDWGGYYRLQPGDCEWRSILQIPDQDSFINQKDLEYSYQQIFNFYEIPSPVELNDTKIIKQASLYFMEGCVGNCAFCETGNTKLKIMPFDIIQDTIKKYVYEYGYTSLFFKNSAINPTRKFVDKFCNWLIQENLNILWSDSARFHHTDQDFFDMIWESGCRSLGWGCEMMDNDMLKFINKKITVEEITESLVMSHSKGIWNIMNFVFGMPGETPQVIDNTITWIKDFAFYMDECHYNDYCVKPNSPFFTNSQDFGLEKIDNNIVDPKSGLNSEQTYFYRKEIMKIVHKYLYSYRKLEVHTSQILTFPLYDLFEHDKSKVRWWLNQNYKPYNEIIMEDVKNG